MKNDYLVNVAGRSSNAWLTSLLEYT